MKRMQIQVLLVVILFGGLPMNAMLSQAARSQAARGQAATRTAQALRPQVVRPISRAAMPTLRQRFWSWWSGSRPKAAPVTVPRVSAAPFAPGGQKRAFSTTPTASFWDKVTSYFQPKPLTAQEFAEKLENIIRNHKLKSFTAPNGRVFEYRWVFDDVDLNKAKKLIDDNENFINELMNNYLAYIFGRVIINPNPSANSTTVDIIFMSIFGGDYFMMGDFTPSDNMLNLIKLAEYVIDKGGVINPVQASKYENIYLDVLMSAYRRLYSSMAYTRYGVEYELKTMKEMFKELDPILENLIPEFKEKLHRAQQERANIEQNIEAYREQIKDQEDREEFMQFLREEKESAWRREHHNWDPDIDRIEWKGVKFDEKKYQEWLKLGKPGSLGWRFRTQFGQVSGVQYQGKFIWDLLPDLTASSPQEEIKKAYRKYSMMNHPDKLEALVQQGLLSRKDADKKIEKYKEVNDAWDAYNASLRK